MKRALALLIACGLLLGVTATSSFAADKVVIKMAGMKPDGEPETLGMRQFGEVSCRNCPAANTTCRSSPTASSARKTPTSPATRKGIIQMCATGTQTSALQPCHGHARNAHARSTIYAHARRAMDGGKTFELITNGFTEKSGMRVLNAFPLGFRHFYTKKPVATIDDMKHLRMRVPNIPLYINFAKECGISGQPMPFAEVTGALDQGVIDGGDSPLSDIVSIKMYETTPHITLTGHTARHPLPVHQRKVLPVPARTGQEVDSTKPPSVPPTTCGISWKRSMRTP